MDQNDVLELRGGLQGGKNFYKLLFTIIKYDLLYQPEEFDLKIYWDPKHVSIHTHFEDTEPWQKILEFLIHHLNINANKINISHHIGDPYPNDEHYLTRNFWPYNQGERFLSEVKTMRIFRESRLQTQKNKVCFWRYNKDLLCKPKNLDADILGKSLAYSPEEWSTLFDFLKTKYNLIELEYRTPIREVFYHLTTCEFVVANGGMWHNLATSLGKPMISIINTLQANSSVLNLNDPTNKTTYNEVTLNRAHPNEYVCHPTIEQITDDIYFEVLLKQANSMKRNF